MSPVELITSVQRCRRWSPEGKRVLVEEAEQRSVDEFIESACEYLDLNSVKIIVKDKKLFRPLEVNCLIGDAAKAKKLLKWKPDVTFKNLVKIMVQKDLDHWQAHLNGKIFPWDAINDPSFY